MSISFRGAKKYKKHNGFDKSAEIHSPLPAPVYFFNLVQNTDVALSPLVEVGDTVESPILKAMTQCRYTVPYQVSLHL